MTVSFKHISQNFGSKLFKVVCILWSYEGFTLQLLSFKNTETKKRIQGTAICPCKQLSAGHLPIYWVMILMLVILTVIFSLHRAKEGNPLKNADPSSFDCECFLPYKNLSFNLYFYAFHYVLKIFFMPYLQIPEYLQIAFSIYKLPKEVGANVEYHLDPFKINQSVQHFIKQS